MSANRDESVPGDDLAARLRDWLRQARGLAARAGAADAMGTASALYGDLGREGVRIVFVGGPNAGKSRAINRFLGGDVLPVTALSESVELRVEPAGAGESPNVSVDGGPSRPLAELPAAIKEAQASGGSVAVRVASPKLGRRGLTLVEAPLDVAEPEIPGLVTRLLGGGDAAVVVLDADAAMRRSDRHFLAECLRRGIPTVVAVAKADRIPEEERDELFAYVAGNVGDPDRTPVVPVPDPDGGSGELAAAIEGTLADLDPIRVRARQVADVLAGALDGLLATAAAAREHLDRDQSQREEALRDRRNGLARSEHVWQELRLGLERRRQKLEGTLREHLATNRRGLLESLLFELGRANDVKSWWERDLPYRLQRELRTLASQMTGTANRQIVADVHWLREELQRRLSQALPLSGEATIQVRGEMPRMEEQALSDANFLKIFSRLGTGAAVVAAGTMFATAGVGGMVMASSIGAGLFFEQVIRMRSEADREKVRRQLDALVVEAELTYAEDVSRQLAEGYDRVVEDLRAQQARWQQGQIRALQEFSERPSDPAIAEAAAAAEPIRALAAAVREAARGD